MDGELLHAQRNALLVIVKVQDDHVDLLVHFNHLFRMANSAVAHVGDVPSRRRHPSPRTLHRK